MRFNFALSTAASTLAIGVAAISTPAFAQSTGSVDFEKEIVVTGTRSGTQQVEGVSAPDTPKAKAVLTSEAIERASPGQSVLDTINQIPGVSFQNNDAYGSSGGTLSIRGFDASRISLTFDGVPLNDSGNYAIFSNQQIDPELIEQVNVNLGTTDVDSPTASAVGGTVNIRTKTPSRDFGFLGSASIGEYDFWRVFGMIETGDLTSSGTRAWFSASTTKNRLPFNNYGKVDKQQFNFKLHQPLGGNDFISIAGHYNQNRNNFFGSVPLRIDTTQTPPTTAVPNPAPRVVGPNSGNRFPITADERFYNINYPCALDTPQAGVGDTPAAAPTNQGGCGTEFDRRYNPSNTGNIRINSKFTLANNLVLTIDPSYQYVKANGGGTVTGSEGLRDINPAGGTTPAFGAISCATATPVTATCVSGYFGGTPFFGRDVNGDGDTLDTVTVLAPSQTQTQRIGVIAGLRWNLDDNNSVRIAYTYDRARHRQTGEVGFLNADGEPMDVFPVNGGAAAASGSVLQKRDRLSFAILQQVAAEYTGKFMDGDLTVNLGIRAPFYRRNLTNNCFTSSAGGFVECSGQNAALNTTMQTLNPYTFNSTTNAVTGWAVPQQRVFNYNRVLPNLGLVYKVGDSVSFYGSYAKGISVPGTDSLYNAFYFPAGTAQATPAPETTDNFDLGLRFRSGKVQASFSAFYNKFQNRLATAYDPELDQNVYRNLGRVKKYGVDGFISYKPVDQFSIFAGVSLINSEIQDDIEVAKNQDGTPIYAATAGKHESGSPTYTVNLGARGHVGPFTLGLTAKRTGPRYVFDTNLPTYTGFYRPDGAKTSANLPPVLSNLQLQGTRQIYGAQAPAYWLVHLDARVDLDFTGLPEGTYLQLNVYNLFDQMYAGGFGGGLIQANTYSRTTGIASYGNPTNVQIGAPRTVSGTLVVKF
jgi:iron complex outermembrane recepter protein